MSDDVDSEARTAAESDDEESPDADETLADESLADDATALAERVAEYDEDLADEVYTLAERVATLESTLEERESEVADLTDRLKRTRADFQNYKKRAKKRQDQLEERATEDFVTRVVSVRDNFVRALDQDDDADLRDGLEGTLKEFDRILAEENVTPVEPDAGDDVDPERHEVLMRVESDYPAGTVVDVYRPGYEMAGKVVQTAQVTVSEE
jgi:molecular chaperone GrpE